MFQLLLFSLALSSAPDSLRSETINGKVYVIHQVGERETLYGIARRYGATIADVLAQNPAADAGIEVGQILKVPYTPRVKGQPPKVTADGMVHKVAAKETLFSIARQYNVSVDDLKAWNNLKETSLNLGQEIVIRKKAIAETVVETTSPSSAKTHTVAPKETLFSIARLYGMTVTKLKEWNALEGNELKIGQVLTVAEPAQQAAVVQEAVVTEVKPAETKTTSVTISESITGTDEMRESGMAELIPGTEGNRKYLGQHRTVKPGTILKVRNLTTNQEVFVRITGAPFSADPAIMLRISRSACERLGATDTAPFKVEVTYYK
jgi:LysM repeat protein